MVDTGEWSTVYNLRVVDHHTNFVGKDEWGFSVWAHNTSCDPVFVRNWNDATVEILSNPALGQLIKRAQTFRNSNQDFDRNFAIALGVQNGHKVFAPGLSKGRPNHSEREIWEKIQSWDSITAYFSERVPCDTCRNPLGGPNARNWYYKTMSWTQQHGSSFKLFCVTNAVSDDDPQAATNVSNFYASLPEL